MRRGVGVVLALTVSAVLVGCSGAEVPATSGTSPTAAPASKLPAPASEPAVAGSVPPAAPADAALAAYERYMAASVEALAAGDTDAAALTDVAADQALQHVRRRLRANARDGVVVTGSLEPSATPGDVRYDGATATVTDCALNALEQVSADDPDRVVTEATGWRQPVRAVVEQRGGGWIVTRVRVPLRDGSGRVPPPPDDPPYLRGPAQGPAPPSCVPDAIARDAVEAYGAFVDAYDEAIGFGGTGPVDPALPAIETTMTEPQLSSLRAFVADLRASGEAFRGERDAHDPWAVASRESDAMVIVLDCVAGGRHARVDDDVRFDSPLDADVAGLPRLDAADVIQDGPDWKVAGVSTIERGLDSCASPARSL
jgi:hypothetical protein